MQNAECISCRKPKANFECEICEESVCKNCSHVLDKGTFSFMDEVPELLTRTLYCNTCYDHHVAPELDVYQEIMERAKKVFVFFTTQRKEIPLIRRSKTTVSVEDREDRDDTILRLGFLAAKENYNAITEVTVVSQKIRHGGYQTSVWKGSGIPAQIDEEKMDRQDRLNQIYR
jgi:hypothetical protein